MVNIKTNKGEKIIVDEEDFDRLQPFTWFVNGKGYAAATINCKNMYLHRYILNVEKGMVVDHINGNPLDNRKSNLRICTQRENSKNITKSKKGTSKYKGVYFHKKNKKWVAYITNDYKAKYLGSFETEEEGAKAYNNAAIKLFGEFAVLNDF